jgi:hypothetical protein
MTPKILIQSLCIFYLATVRRGLINLGLKIGGITPICRLGILLHPIYGYGTKIDDSGNIQWHETKSTALNAIRFHIQKLSEQEPQEGNEI